VGEALIAACENTGDPDLRRARDRLLDWALTGAPRNEEGVVYHFVEGREFWVDSFYMLPPFLAHEGFYDEALRQIEGWWGALYDPEMGLVSHRWDAGKGEFIRRDFWGTGNGWAAAGLSRVIALLPAGMEKERQKLILRLKTLLSASFAYQREDGMFYNVLNDPDSFPEVNAGQMFSYALYRGMAAGYMEEGSLEKAERAREAALRQIDDFGLVRNVCGAPDFDHPGVSPEGQAFFILMEAARRDYLASLR
jgi:rhamnogalacturonyl hydrolase YesR